MNSSYDAILIQSFGGPEGMDDVMPFLRNVTRGRNIPDERLKTVAHHYELFGGVSPINQQNRQMIAALQQLIDQEGPHLPIYFGNRNWHPFLEDTLRQMQADGIKNAVSFATAAYSSFSSCRQYLDDIERARSAVGPEAPLLTKIKPYFNHPLFIDANIEQLRPALEQTQGKFQLVFSAHSIPTAMADGCRYKEQLMEASRQVARAVGVDEFALVFQSRSGPPTQAWLEPDILDFMRDLRSKGISELVLLPIGFVSDHMEVIYDLDTEAKALADELSMKLIRAKTAGAHPNFVRMIRELILEMINPEKEDLQAKRGIAEFCAQDCCPSGKPAGAPVPSQREMK